MKKVITFLLVMVLVAGVVPAYAQKAPITKGASTTAVQKAGDEAVFHRVGDWFATLGKTPEEKQAIIAERKAKRVAQRTQKEAEKAQKELMKQTQKTQKTLDEQAAKVKKQIGK